MIDSNNLSSYEFTKAIMKTPSNAIFVFSTKQGVLNWVFKKN